MVEQTKTLKAFEERFNKYRSLKDISIELIYKLYKNEIEMVNISDPTSLDLGTLTMYQTLKLISLDESYVRLQVNSQRELQSQRQSYEQEITHLQFEKESLEH